MSPTRNTLTAAVVGGPPASSGGGASFIRKWLNGRKVSQKTTSRTTGYKKQAASAVESVRVNIDDAMKTVYPPDTDIVTEEDLDYDSLSLYFVEGSQEKAMVRKELQRLAATVENPDSPLVFTRGQHLGSGNRRGYHALNVLTIMISRVKRICNVDNDGISLVYAPLGLTPEQYQRSLYQLQPSRTTLYKMQVDSETGEANHEARKNVAKDAAALLDFISDTLARFMSQIASGDSWRNSQLGALAKFTAKAKFLLNDVDEYASIALHNGEMALASSRETYGTASDNKTTEELDPNTVFQRFAGSLSADPEQATYVRSTEYRVNQQKIRAGFMQVLDYIIASLFPNTRHRGFGITEYEICGVVMETGFHDFQTLLFQDRDFEFTSTSDLDQLNFAHPASKMLDSSIKYLIQNSPPPNDLQSMNSEKTRTVLEWKYSDTESDDFESRAVNTKIPHPRSCQLRSMNDITTILVLLALATPVVSGRYKRFLDMFYLTADFENIIRPFPERPFKAFVRLYTTDFEEARKLCPPSDVLQLSEAVNAGLFSRTSLLHAGDATMDDPKRVKKLTEINELMDS
ncbi:hypothetical protein PT974_01566 [Cladobotryum mycophilum]|uniref:Uncharacterized protein n=1 Tax=Cladobotryum mycophilum TaxID=491253 RepID=A0ABR0T417_9HYPO